AQPFSTGRVGAVGFCGGGRGAYPAAARSGGDAAASLYGVGISPHLDEPPHRKLAVQLPHRLNDQHVPRAGGGKVSSAVRGRSNIEVLLYPGAGHSFANPVRPTYDPAATKLAYERIGAMLQRM